MNPNFLRDLCQEMVRLDALEDDAAYAAARKPGSSVHWGDQCVSHREEIANHARDIIELCDTHNQALAALDKAAGFDRAKRFYDELLGACESFKAVVDRYGHRTIMDLMYLQQAILSNGYIDHYPNESAVMTIVSTLPSADEWMRFIKVESLDGTDELRAL